MAERHCKLCDHPDQDMIDAELCKLGPGRRSYRAIWQMFGLMGEMAESTLQEHARYCLGIVRRPPKRTVEPTPQARHTPGHEPDCPGYKDIEGQRYCWRGGCEHYDRLYRRLGCAGHGGECAACTERMEHHCPCHEPALRSAAWDWQRRRWQEVTRRRWQRMEAR
jgi:hypothetical protein